MCLPRSRHKVGASRVLGITHTMPTIISFPRRSGPVPADPVQIAYDALAPAYDAFTAAYRHDRWLDAIERVAEVHGLQGRRLLDIACGTGKSFLPLLERGYDVTACDLSPEMARRAAGKAPSARAWSWPTCGRYPRSGDSTSSPVSTTCSIICCSRTNSGAPWPGSPST
jgi:SAM-dependent methyltransferase